MKIAPGRRFLASTNIPRTASLSDLRINDELDVKITFFSIIAVQPDRVFGPFWALSRSNNQSSPMTAIGTNFPVSGLIM
jgi:hypothetical protein